MSNERFWDSSPGPSVYSPRGPSPGGWVSGPSRYCGVVRSHGPRASELTLRFGFHELGRRGALLGLVVFLVVLPTRLVGLSSPTGMQFDEVYHGRAAGEYLAGKEIFEYTHPPLAKELMALSLGSLSPAQVTRGAESPPGMSEGLVATDGRNVSWASSSEGGTLTSGIFDGDCSVAPRGTPTPLEFEPTAVVQTLEGVFVGGDDGSGGAVAWVVGGGVQWRAKIPEVPVSIGVVGQTGFVLDAEGTLLLVRNGGGHSVVARHVGTIASDRSADKIWASQPDRVRVLAFDSAGEKKANVTLAGKPGAMVLAHEIPRLVVAGADGPRLEGVNPDESEWAGESDGLSVETFGHVPEADVVWGIDGRRVRLIEALGLTEIGTAELPETPVAFVGDLERNMLIAVGSDRLTCVSQDHAFGWRFPSALLGAAAAALAFLLALRLFGSLLTALLAAVFVALDGLLFVMSRVAMIDSYLVAFILASWFSAVSTMHHWGRRDEARSERRGSRRSCGCSGRGSSPVPRSRRNGPASIRCSRSCFCSHGTLSSGAMRAYWDCSVVVTSRSSRLPDSCSSCQWRSIC